MSKESAEGIILQLTPFRDYDAIVTLFTREHGLLKVGVRRGMSKRRQLAGTLQPLAQVEVFFDRSKGEIHRSTEISLLSAHLKIRQTLPLLQAACDMVHSLQRSQLPEKPSPALFALFTTLLGKLPTFPAPPLLPLLFQLKILRHEGVWPFGGHCSLCPEPPTAIDGEPFCQRHAPPHALPFSPQEIELLEHIVLSRSLSSLSLPLPLVAKVPLLFANLLAGKRALPS